MVRTIEIVLVASVLFLGIIATASIYEKALIKQSIVNQEGC